MKFSSALLVWPVLLSGCGASTAPVTNPMPVSQPPSEGKAFNYETTSSRATESYALVEAQNAFGARLIARLEKNNSKHKNLLASPTSLWQALAMTAGGAKGTTKSQLSALLSMEKLPDDKIGAQNKSFNALLAEQKGASISVANSLWFADAFKANPTFVSASKTNFGAGVELFSAGKPDEGAARINEWVSAQTKKEITSIVSADDVAGQSALLVNAVYFKGGWDNVFDASNTKPAPFHLSDGTVVQVPTMNAQRSRSYLSGTSFEGARLPYKNTSCALWVLLPKTGKTPTDVLNELGEAKSRQLNASGSVIVSLPRFDIEWRQNVKTDLAALDAPLPFSGGADFSLMGTPTMGISAVLHVCKMRVDEEGTVAAAATVVGMTGSAAPKPEEPKVIKFDRPFVVALVEETSGARLFEGAVYNPATK